MDDRTDEFTESVEELWKAEEAEVEPPSTQQIDHQNSVLGTRY
jgi:hypothetical protein